MSIPNPREAPVLRACLDYLRAVRGWLAWRNNSGARRVGRGFVRWGLVGSADIFCVVPPDGLFLGVETKRPGGKVTVAQRVWGDAVRRAGGVVLVVSSVQELEAALREAGLA